MVENADDPSKVIIFYGVNDCVPRMIVVDKAEIIQMLFDVEARWNRDNGDWVTDTYLCVNKYKYWRTMTDTYLYVTRYKC